MKNLFKILILSLSFFSCSQINKHQIVTTFDDVIFNDNGDMMYNNKKFNGQFITYWENGKKYREKTYKDGKEIEATYWDEYGNKL